MRATRIGKGIETAIINANFSLGYRRRVWETQVGEIPLRIPKMREGNFFPGLLGTSQKIGENLVGLSYRVPMCMVSAHGKWIICFRP